MPDTFGGEWHRPGERKRKDPQRGRSLHEVRTRAGFDNEPQLGCGAMFLLLVIAAAAALGAALS